VTFMSLTWTLSISAISIANSSSGLSFVNQEYFYALCADELALDRKMSVGQRLSSLPSSS
jgi:hypothetical protein